MTHSELSKLNPREVDALVAEKVMGWPFYNTASHAEGEREYPHCWRVTRHRFFVFDGETNRLFTPTTEIAHAWQVALWLRECWGSFDLQAGLQWHCFGDTCGEKLNWGVADTAELAICIAALKAVGVVEDDRICSRATGRERPDEQS